MRTVAAPPAQARRACRAQTITRPRDVPTVRPGHVPPAGRPIDGPDRLGLALDGQCASSATRRQSEPDASQIRPENFSTRLHARHITLQISITLTAGARGPDHQSLLLARPARRRRCGPAVTLPPAQRDPGLIA